MRYKAAHIKADVEVTAYAENANPGQRGGGARRTVNLSFNESFADDKELDLALDAFGAAIREAARR